MTQRPKILIALPTMGELHVYLAMQIMGWLTKAQSAGNLGIMIFPSVCITPVDEARNMLVQEFLKTDCTHLLFIDSDTIPPIDALDKLLAADKDIISAITPIVEYDAARDGKNDSNGFYKKWNCVSKETKTFVQPDTGILEIMGCGSACVLIKREVFEKISQPYYRFRYEDDNGKPCYVGEDVQFIAKATQAGFKSYADTSIKCGHYKPIIW